MRALWGTTIAVIVAGVAVLNFAPGCGGDEDCFDLGTCACTFDTECDYLPTDACQVPACVEGACGVVQAAEGSPCNGGTCDAFGQCLGEGGGGGQGGTGSSGGGGAGAGQPTAIFADSSASCVLRNEGELWCWGITHYGGSDPNSVPAHLPVGKVRDFGVGASFGCVLGDDEKVRCWGNGDTGKLGNGSTDPQAEPQEVVQLGDSQRIAIGTARGCALAGGLVYCWGDSNQGQIPGLSENFATIPEWVETPPAVSLGVSGQHSCVATVAGEVLCWGSNLSGGVNPSLPAEPQGMTSLLPAGIARVAVGSAHNCALGNDEVVTCWGDTSLGQLAEPGPAVVSGLPDGITQVVAGGVHMCVRTTGGEVWCWGNGIFGQLGNGQALSSPTPVQVQGLPCPATSIDAGGVHTCSLCEDGVVACWGNNENGQVGGSIGAQVDSPRVVTF